MSTAPGMPMNVMAEATSDTMITVSWESPAADGGSAVTRLRAAEQHDRHDGLYDHCGQQRRDLVEHLDCPMMNAEIPDDATPAPPAGRYRHDIALLRDVRRAQ